MFFLLPWTGTIDKFSTAPRPTPPCLHLNDRGNRDRADDDTTQSRKPPVAQGNVGEVLGQPTQVVMQQNAQGGKHDRGDRPAIKPPERATDKSN
jgi:hypothetical protein